jgi:hypothetical protein
MQPLATAFAKVRRAKDEFSSLTGEFDAFLRDARVAIFQEIDAESGEHVISVEFGGRPPLAWSVRLGEVIHDLRSSLDYLISDLVTFEGAAPSRQNQFPVFTRETGHRSFEDRGRVMLRGIPSAKVPFFESIQPFPRLNPEGRLHPLLALTKLSNADKHRLINLTVAIFEPTKLKIIPRTAGFSRLNWTFGTPIERRTEVARGPAAGEVQYVIEEAFKVAFHDSPYVGNRRVDQVIPVLIGETNKVLVAAREQLFR